LEHSAKKPHKGIEKSHKGREKPIVLEMPFQKCTESLQKSSNPAPRCKKLLKKNKDFQTSEKV